MASPPHRPQWRASTRRATSRRGLAVMMGRDDYPKKAVFQISGSMSFAQDMYIYLAIYTHTCICVGVERPVCTVDYIIFVHVQCWYNGGINRSSIFICRGNWSKFPCGLTSFV